MDKEKFYIFLDIDGVMWDLPYLIRQLPKHMPIINTSIRKFKPESVNALKGLIKGLSDNFDVELVVSSTWRKNMVLIQSMLVHYKIIDYTTPLFKTPKHASGLRGEEIMFYLDKDFGTKNFVIIDDNIKNITPYFNRKKIIKTSLKNSLSLKQIEEFFKNFENNYPHLSKDNSGLEQ